MVPLAIAGGVALIFLSRSWGVRVGSAIYMMCGLQLFGLSAVYHLGNWKPRALQGLQRIDHSDIFVFIAGCYTPMAIALLTGWSRALLLSLVWTCAAIGVALNVFHVKAPRVVTVLLYIAVGWIAIAWLPAVWMVHWGPAVVILTLICGLFYTLGAVVYAKRWPDPAPAWFGYHEIFHAMTMVAAVVQWVALVLSVRH